MKNVDMFGKLSLRYEKSYFELIKLSASFPNVEPCVFWGTEITVIPKSTLGKGEITQVFQDL